MRQSLVPALSDPTCAVTDAGGGRLGNVVGDLGLQQRANGVERPLVQQLDRGLAVFGRRVGREPPRRDTPRVIPGAESHVAFPQYLIRLVGQGELELGIPEPPGRSRPIGQNVGQWRLS